MLDNYIQVGIVRAVNTLLMVAAMAFGIAFAVKLCSIADFFPTISMVITTLIGNMHLLQLSRPWASL